ncbi:BCCT family transporter [Desulfoluna sp.]|uniref:BCCT family transporter n=1 Tax=Desulfoluna sp. TaxID=2045199 RepID=UPI002608AF1D|nr:BCCT family transporter [Desulfoluna sp.]
MDRNSTKWPIQPMAFFPAFICMVVFISVGILNTDALGSFLNGALDVLSAKFGWLYMLVALACVVFSLYFSFSKFGDIRIGGQDAKPDLTMWQWFSICLCSGIGTGILFWGMGEPMFFYAEPSQASGLVPFSHQAGVNAISQAAFHWTIMQYSMYTMGALGAALVAYGKASNFSVSASLSGLLGEKAAGTVGHIINGICLFALCGAVSCSMGAALLQIGSGLNNLFGVSEGKLLWLVIAIVITATYTFSSITGMKKGLSFLSSLNTKIFLGLALVMLLLGPTNFIADIGVAALGDMFSTFFDKATVTNALTTDQWAKNWTVQYWASMIVVAPLIGLFYARLAKGRTVRQFIAMTIFGPSAFCFIWISIFGGTAIYLQSSGSFDMWASIQANGMQNTVFAIFNQYPLAKVFIAVFLFAIFASLVTYADPMTSVLATLSCKSLHIDQEPPRTLKLLWGGTIGTIAYLIIATGGIDGIRGMFTLIGFPLMFLLIGICVSAVISAARYFEKGAAMDSVVTPVEGSCTRGRLGSSAE